MLPYRGMLSSLRDQNPGFGSATEDKTTEAPTLFRFGQAEFDSRAHELRVNGRVMAVEPKVLKVLGCLLARPGETLTKDELLEAAWTGRIVSESTLAKAVMKLRAVLGEEGNVIIRTVHGFGYRLGVPVEALSSDAPARFIPASGQIVPLRPNWRMVEALDADSRGMVWLAEHEKTRDRRVFKFASDGEMLTTLKREITLYRLLRDSLGPAAPVVQILDWNLDEPPYFTESEWVTDGDLSNWITSEATFAERVEAIAQACEAVAASHGLGVVHKDLKPANLLIRRLENGRLQILLADFGIGALSDRRAIEALGITQLGFSRTGTGASSSSGTPLYLAPEVIGGATPTQRSDIYALGVMLYQALVGDPRKPLAPGWERDIDDELLRGDIAAAADVDPERRLGDAAELARRLRTVEVRRAKLEADARARTEAVTLRDDLERARVRRRRLAGVSVLMLVMLTVVSVMALQMRLAQQQARFEADTAAAVNDFLIHDLLAQADPLVAGRRDVGVRELLDVAALHVGTRFADRPGSEAGVRLALGSAFRNLAEYESASRQLEAALKLANQSAEAARLRDPLALELAALNINRERYENVAPLIEPLLEHANPELAAQAALTLARADEKTGAYDRSLVRVEMVLSRIDGESALAASALGQKGVTLIAMGRYDEAVVVNRLYLQAKRRLFGDGDIRTLDALRSTGLSLYYAERFEEALETIEQAHQLALAVLGDRHDQTLVVAADIGLLYQELGQLERAETIMLEALDTRIELFGEDSRDARTLLNNLGVVYGEMGKRDAELDYVRRAWQAELRISGEAHPDTLVSAHNVARALRDSGRYAEAEPMQRQTLQTAIESLGADHPYVGIMTTVLADVLGQLGQLDEAEQRIDDAIEMLQTTLGAEHSMTERALSSRARIRSLREEEGGPTSATAK